METNDVVEMMEAAFKENDRALVDSEYVSFETQWIGTLLSSSGTMCIQPKLEEDLDAYTLDCELPTGEFEIHVATASDRFRRFPAFIRINISMTPVTEWKRARTKTSRNFNVAYARWFTIIDRNLQEKIYSDNEVRLATSQTKKKNVSWDDDCDVKVYDNRTDGFVSLGQSDNNGDGMAGGYIGYADGEPVSVVFDLHLSCLR